MNKEIVVEEIAKTLCNRSRFATIGHVLEFAEEIYDKLEVIGALKPARLPPVIEVKDKAGIERLKDAMTELQNKRIANG